MPIGKKWTRATETNIKLKAPGKKGVYELKSFGEVKYIGSSNDIRRRLLEHLDERDPNYFRYETAGFLTSPTKLERQHYDRHVDKHGSPPDWNEKRP